MTMRVVHVIARFSPSEWGGAEEVVLNLARQQAAQAYDVQVFTTKDSFLSHNGERLVATQVRSQPEPRFRVREFAYLVPTFDPALRRKWVSRGIHMVSPSMAVGLLALRQRDTVVHLHLHNSVTAVSAFCCLLRGIPYILHLHSRYNPDAGREDTTCLRIPRRLFSHHQALRHAAALICLTEAETSRLRTFFPRKTIVTIPNAMEPGRFSSANAQRFRGKHGLGDRIVVLNVAKIYPLKNQLFLIRLLQSLKSSFPQMVLVLVGHVEDREYFARLRQEITASHLERDVIIVPGLLPSSQELGDVYAGSDCFLLSSLEEAFPLVVLETWASRLPIIASTTNGTSALISTGVNGILVSGFDIPKWVASVKAILSDGHLRTSLTKNGWETVSTKYGWRGIVEQVGDLYAQTVSAGRNYNSGESSCNTRGIMPGSLGRR